MKGKNVFPTAPRTAGHPHIKKPVLTLAGTGFLIELLTRLLRVGHDLLDLDRAGWTVAVRVNLDFVPFFVA
jgi:hypothetical protein